jgi:hypothetical protein
MGDPFAFLARRKFMRAEGELAVEVEKRIEGIY